MHLYFLLIRLAAVFGHKKARLLVNGQKAALETISRLRGENVIWFHAASVGEFEQARPIIEQLKNRNYGVENCKILLTFFSPSGYEMRKNYDKADVVAYLPFATRRNARKLLDCIHVKTAVFVKYEFWPAYLKELRRRNIKTYSISAIFRRGQLFFMPWGRPYLRLLKCFTHIFVQDENSRHLLARHNITNVSIAGDTRFDRVNAIAAAAKQIPLVEQFIKNHPETKYVIVAGSTWPEDEKLFARYMAEREDVLLILVPHEIHEGHLHQIFQQFHGKYIRYTEANEKNLFTCRIMVLDTMGMLSSIYRYATVTYIGGGFGVGIHNTLEAAVYGVPVLFGPNYYKFREAKGLLAAGASQSVNNYRKFAAAMDNALTNAGEMGRKARAYVESELGATEKIMRSIF